MRGATALLQMKVIVLVKFVPIGHLLIPKLGRKRIANE